MDLSGPKRVLCGSCLVTFDVLGLSRSGPGPRGCRSRSVAHWRDSETWARSYRSPMACPFDEQQQSIPQEKINYTCVYMYKYIYIYIIFYLLIY